MTQHSDQSKARSAIFFSNLGHSYTHMFTVLYATAVLYLPRVFDLSYGELLGLSSLGLVLFGVAALPAGWLSDRWSQVGMMVVFFIGVGAGAIVTGLARGPDMLFAGLTMIGLFAAIYHPVGIAWIVAWARRQGMTLGVNGVFGSIGNAMAPVFVGLMIDYVSWRAAFIIPGVLAILTGFALAFAWWRGWVEEARSDRAPPSETDRGAVVRVFFVLTVTMACTGFVYSGMANTMPKLFEMGLGEDLAGSYTRIGLLVGAVTGLASLSSIFGGWLADRYSARSIYMVFWALMAPLLFMIVSLAELPLLLVAFLVLSFNLTFAAAENMLVAHYTPFRWRAVAYGAKFVLALGVGGLTVHLAGWLFVQEGDFGLLYILFGSAAVLATAAAALLPGGRPRAVIPASAD